MEMENIHGLISLHIKVTGNKAKSMDKEFIFMLTEEFMKAHLKTIKCKVKEFILGQMEESILVRMKKIKSTDWVDIIGLTGSFSKANGNREIDMVMDKWFILTESLNKEFGKTIRKFSKTKNKM